MHMRLIRKLINIFLLFTQLKKLLRFWLDFTRIDAAVWQVKGTLPPTRMLFLMHEKHNIQKTASTNCLPDDLSMRSETCRKCRKSK